MSGVLPIYNKNFVLTRDSSCFFKMLSQLREVRHHSRRTVWMTLRFRRLDTDSPLFPIDVLPSQRQSFAWCSKPSIACQRDYRLPSNIAEWLLVLHPCGRENSHPKMPVTYEPAVSSRNQTGTTSLLCSSSGRASHQATVAWSTVWPNRSASNICSMWRTHSSHFRRETLPSRIAFRFPSPF